MKYRLALYVNGRRRRIASEPMALAEARRILRLDKKNNKPTAGLPQPALVIETRIDGQWERYE